jgi:hypothetical protein
VRLEAVVDGQVAPEDLTPSEKLLLNLADAARSQASTKELAGLGDALIVYAAQHRDQAEPGATWSRSRQTFGRMRSAGAVAAVVVVLSAGAAAAATTGELPTPLQHIAHSTLGAPAPGRHAHPHHAAKAHETKQHSAKPETSAQTASAVPTASKSVPLAKPSGSPRASNVAGKPVVGAGIVAHHHRYVTRTHRSADPNWSVHSHPQIHHQHYRNHRHHHYSGSSGSTAPTPKPSSSGSWSPRH